MELREKYIQKHLGVLLESAKEIEGVKSSRIYAGLIYKGEIISFGYCRRKTHPFQKRFGKNEQAIYLHAETDCILNALDVLSKNEIAKSTMIVARNKKVGKCWHQAMAKPCIGCQRALAHFNISDVVYTTEEGLDYL